ncbi:hypothetical protein Rhopal_005746-T1 [Rhodotorula paludigena]|uniref:Uncharacterized protein n=1 Tax=Rhodotorula paludigena TaxID=86838 RepID=A0AAV5GT66_9BASI|nr:hypothetical protein Rhopal_005746-T1 [Rhodotorula paludigena]
MRTASSARHAGVSPPGNGDSGVALGDDLGGFDHGAAFDDDAGADFRGPDGEFEGSEQSRASPRPDSPAPQTRPDGTIEVVYHGKSGFPTVVVEPSSSCPVPSPVSIIPSLPADGVPVVPQPASRYGPHPYSPFETLADFRLARLPIELGMTTKETDLYYQSHADPLVHPVPPALHCHSFKKLTSLLDGIDNNPFVATELKLETSLGNTICVRYWQRSFRTCFERVVNDARVARWVRWGVEKWYRWQNGVKERLYGEVTTGDSAWTLADDVYLSASLSQPPEHPFLFAIFSDEALASRFAGTSRVYPVVLWPTSVSQLGRALGSGAAPQVVAFLPLLPETAVASLPVAERSRIKAKLDQQARQLLADALYKIIFVGLVASDPAGLERRVRPLLAQLALDHPEA